MRVIKKEVGKAARWVDIENSLESLQREVGGYIEAVTLTSDCALIVNEEGRLIGLPYNCTVCNLDLVGPVLAVGIDGEEFADCPLPAMRLLFGVLKVKRNKLPTSGLDLVQRKQLERLYEIGKHRDAAAQTAMMLSCICLNHDHHFGMKRLLEHHARTKEMIDKFYEDPEQGCAWIKRELERIGFAESSLEEVMDALAVSDDLGKKLKRMEGKR